MTVLSHSEQLKGAPLNGGHFFEGAEKRLEIYFQSDTAGSLTAPDLRTILQSSWETALNIVKCKVISVISNSEMIAYLLSESSMFITRNSVLIKTCGSTILLHCLQTLLQLAHDVGFGAIQDLYYSHKNMLAPDSQLAPHKSFEKECEYLNQHLKLIGVAISFGSDISIKQRPISADSFYLYLLNNSVQNHSNIENGHLKFEIIMEKLDETVMAHFIFKNKPSVTSAEVTINSGIFDLIDGMQIDDFNFSDCGYSMNGLKGRHYMTMHITPEPQFSYVSLETNIPFANYTAFIQKVVNCFKPAKFMISMVTPKQGDELGSDRIFEKLAEAQFNGFRRLDLQLAHFNFVDSIYVQYCGAL